MSLPDEIPPVAPFVQEEITDGATRTLAAFLSHLPPIVRLRLLAFMHLVEDPATLKAALEITPVRLHAPDPGCGRHALPKPSSLSPHLQELKR